MEDQEIYLFVRVRGKVAGPFDFQKLVSLARKGQLSRMHEVSTDQMSWQRAGTSYPQIWEGWTVAAPTPVEEPISFDQAPGVDPAADAAMGDAAVGPLWHYTKGGEEQAPIPLDQLKHLFSLGELTADDEVWTEGMTEWRKAAEMPALDSVVISKRPIPSGAASSGVQVPQQGVPMQQQPQIVVQSAAPAPAPAPGAVATTGVSGGLIACGYIFAFLFTCVGFILGIVILSKGDGGNGAAILLISIVMTFVNIMILSAGNF